MCRFFGVHADQAVHVEPLLVGGKRALLRQSLGDARGELHTDGWGIGWYEAGRPQVVRRAIAAAQDDEFPRVAARVESPTVIAHVRQASVGERSTLNTHPFRHGCWLFAHNGTVTGFERVSIYLREEGDERLMSQVQGDTDSELVFYWLLSRLAQAGMPADRPGRLADMVQVVTECVGRLAAWTKATERAEPARLNFLLSDGRHLLATRWKHSLHWLPPNTVAGRPEARAAIVASEPLGPGDWQEIADQSILAVDADIEAQVSQL